MANPPGSSRPIRVGRYVLHGELAAGGMASVHFGRLLGPGGFSKSVAIKRLHRQFARDPAFSESILEEGRLAARIRHPNVVPPLDVLSEAGELLLVMEYVHGEALSKLLRVARRDEEPVPLAIAAAILSNVLHGLHAAHEAKDERGRPLDIVHRDVSPQNVLVGVDGVARVIDFGIAKAVTSGESTSTGVVKGKVPYLAPEQLEGEQATRRTDVYAASVVLWEILAGTRLFEGEDDGEILRKILGMTVPPPSAYDPSIPAEVDDVVLRGLARSPNRRYATAREMALALEGIVHLATSSVVGAWAERLAAPALAKRAAELAAVEASDRALPSVLPPPPVMVGSMSRSFSSVDPNVTFSSRTVAAPIAELSELPDSQRLEAAPPAAAFTSASAGPVTRPPPAAAPRPPPAGALRKPALEIANVEWLPATAAPPKAERATLRRIAAYGLLIAALGALLLVALMPTLLKSMIVSAAAERGVILSLERVEVSRRALKLVGVRLQASELPGITVQASAVDVGLRRLTVSTVDVADIDVAVVGTHAEIASRLDGYRAAHEARVLDWARNVESFAIASGRIEWRGALGEGSQVLLENVSLDSERHAGRALGQDHRLSAPLVTVRSGKVTAGPWRLDSESRAGATRATLKLDPSGTYPARIDWTTAETGESTIDAAVSRVALSDLHLPSGILGAPSGPATRIELRGNVKLAPRTAAGRAVEGRLLFGASSLAIFPGPARVDLALDLPLAGDADEPIAIDGATLFVSTVDAAAARTTQHATARITGRLDVARPGVALDLAGKSTPIPCSGRGETRLEARIAIPLASIKDALLAFQPVPPCVPRLK